MKKHCFAICAYKESPYLEKCVESIVNQNVKSSVLICTSTPNDYIESIAKKYQIEMIINPESLGIQSDWRFAYDACDAEYVTLVHQDDIYDKRYTEKLYEAITKYDDISIFYSNYDSLHTTAEMEVRCRDVNCRIRNLLCLPMTVPFLQNKCFLKKNTLRFGNSICCSSVTYNKSRLAAKDIFVSDLCFSLDWDIFLHLADMSGRFVYEKTSLTCFRIHQQATSMHFILENTREKEDYIMFCKVWPKWFAKILMLFYKKAYCNYKQLKEEK